MLHGCEPWHLKLCPSIRNITFLFLSFLLLLLLLPLLSRRSDTRQITPRLMRLTVCPAACTLSPRGPISLSHSGKRPIWAITSQPHGKSAQYALSRSRTQTPSLYCYLYGTFPWTYTFPQAGPAVGNRGSCPCLLCLTRSSGGVPKQSRYGGQTCSQVFQVS